MSKKSAVTVAQSTGRTWQGSNGLLHFHSISFADGTTGEYASQAAEQTKFVVGVEAEYEYTPNANPQYAGKIKPVYANAGNFGGGGGGGKRGGDPDTMLLSYCKDLAVARINAGLVKEVDVESVIKDFVKMKAGFDAAKPAAPVAAPVAQPVAAHSATQGEAAAVEVDDLPF